MSQNTLLNSNKKGFKSSLRSYFKLDERNAVLKKEIIGGLSTFLAMVYILAVNPSIVGNSPLLENSNGTKAFIYQGGLFLATAIASFVGSLLMGLFANIPIALAPGMGLNAFFTYNVASSIGFDSALTVTIISGFLYFFLAISPLRQKISELIPNNFKLSIGASIGLFIAYLGLQNSQIIVKPAVLLVDGNIVETSPLVSELGDFSDPLVILALCILFLGLVLHYLKVPGGILITMVIGAIVLASCIGSGAIKADAFNGTGFEVADAKTILLGDYADFSTFKDVAKAGWVGFANPKMWTSPITYFSIFSFIYMDFFDTTGTLVSLNKMVNLDETDPKWFGKANYVDAGATVFGGAIGATTVTSFVESTVGVAAGAKTGIASITTAIMFALSIAAWPIIQVFLPVHYGGPTGTFYQPITGPILIIIGTLMISQLRHFEWKITIDIPMMFLTLVFMTLANSIGEGMAFGSIAFIALNASAGAKESLMKKVHSKKPTKNVVEVEQESSGVNELEISFGTQNEISEVRLDYFKRINWVMIMIASISIAFLIVQTLIKTGVIK